MEDFLPPQQEVSPESYLLLSRGDDGQVASLAATELPTAAPAQGRLGHQVAAAAEGGPAVGAQQRHRRRARGPAKNLWSWRRTKERSF